MIDGSPGGKAPLPRTVSRTASCRVVRALPALVLGAALVLAGGRGARAVDEITTQDYVGPLGVAEEAAAGHTGKGVNIAVIDGPADTTVPELAGADVTVEPTCDFAASAEGIGHGTAVVSLLAARGYGVARDAHITNYAVPTGDGEDDSEGDDSCPGVVDVINRAITDGARVISVSLGEATSASFLLGHGSTVIARAIAQGVVVVAATGNKGRQDEPGSFASQNGIVGVGASDTSGSIQEFSNYGNGLTVLAPGVGIEVRDMATGQIAEAEGTSFATPIVAGFVAVAMQQWPEATANQIVQSLVSTATTGPTGQPFLNPVGLATTDPAQFPDESPLLDKFSGQYPSAGSVADYVDGLIDSESVFNVDPAYVYRGTDEYVASRHPERSALGTSPRYHEPTG